jgi:ABC-type Fe3+-citrate transport system substrate-binding protein
VLIVAVNVGKALPKTEEMEDYLEEHKEGTERNIQNLG